MRLERKACLIGYGVVDAVLIFSEQPLILRLAAIVIWGYLAGVFYAESRCKLEAAEEKTLAIFNIVRSLRKPLYELGLD